MNVLYEFGIGRWLWDLYRNGPMFLGFWGGLGDAEVCARLSGNSNASDWILFNTVTRACENMIQRSFRGLSVTVNAIMYVTCIILLLATLRQWLVAKAMAKTFAHEFFRLQKVFSANNNNATETHAGPSVEDLQRQSQAQSSLLMPKIV